MVGAVVVRHVMLVETAQLEGETALTEKLPDSRESPRKWGLQPLGASCGRVWWSGPPPPRPPRPPPGPHALFFFFSSGLYLV